MEQEALVQKIEQFSDDITLVHRAVHGTETETVLLGGVATPSWRKLVADVDARESAAAQTAIAAGVAAMGDSATAAANSATAAAQSAQIAQYGADVVEAHAAALDIVSGNIAAIQGAAGAATSAANSAADAAASAAEAAAASGGLAPRMTAVEEKNAEQDTVLAAVVLKNAQQDTALAAASVTLDGKASKSLVDATGNAIGFYFYARDEKAAGSTGGSSSSNAWHTRDLNTIKTNLIGATLASNRITLPAGRYYIAARMPTYAGFSTRGGIFNYPAGGLLISGPSHYCGDFGVNVWNDVEGEITLAAQTTIELRTWINSSNPWGLGGQTSTSIGLPGVFSEVRIWKM